MFEFIRSQLENQFLSGGFVLMAFGAVLALLRKVPAQLGAFLHRRFVTTVDVNDQDEAFFWVQEWLSQHPYSKKTRLLSVTTASSSFPPVGGLVKESPHNQAPQIYFTPAPGLHLLRFEKHWILLSRAREKQEGGNHGRFWRESFTIKTLVRDRQFLRRMILAARDVARPPGGERIGIYMNNYGNWNVIGSRLPRDFDSVILEDDTTEHLIHEFEQFATSAEWYRNRGIPYQIGFLFHGPPGNGKTSTAIALASRYNRDVFLARVDLLSALSFRQMMANLPEHAILLIEDVDCLFGKRDAIPEDRMLGGEPLLTFSGFLNGIDGVMGTEGRVLIMTTNHPERLDDALMRPGRIDHRVEFKNANKSMAERLFLRFFPDETDLSEGFAQCYENRTLSMAELQKIMLDNRNDPYECLSSLVELQFQKRAS